MLEEVKVEKETKNKTTKTSDTKQKVVVKKEVSVSKNTQAKPVKKADISPVEIKQLMTRFKNVFTHPCVKKDKKVADTTIYYLFKRMDNLIDAQGKLSDQASSEDVQREQQYKELAKEIFSKGLKEIAALTLDEAYAIYKAIKEEKKAAKEQPQQAF